MLKNIPILEQFEGAIAYDCSGIYYIKLDKGAVVSDHKHEEAQTVYLLEGRAEVVVGEETLQMKAQQKIYIEGGVYHKFTALTDLVALEVKDYN